jgi:hypothetical protein
MNGLMLVSEFMWGLAESLPDFSHESDSTFREIGCIDLHNICADTPTLYHIVASNQGDYAT